MSKLVLDIDGFIGGWGYSKRFVRNFLTDAGKNPVTIRISSLGGAVDHALDIHNQFAEHGDVTAVFSGFNASSATLIALGAKNSRIADNSFYLIHKALIWVDEWGNMNMDDIDQVIAKLEKEKKELETITLTMAKMYVNKTGKTLTEILDLMKQETWLTGEEAVEMGFVDEIFQLKGQPDPIKNEKITAILNYSDLPKLPEAKKPQDPTPVTPDSGKGLFDKVKLFTQKIINNQLKMKEFTALLAVLMIDSLDSNDEKEVFLNQEQLGLINTALEGLKQVELAEKTATCNLATATADLAKFDAIDKTIADAEGTDAKVKAIQDYMTKKPSVQAQGVHSAQDNNQSSEDGVDWDTLNSLPHMQEDNE